MKVIENRKADLAIIGFVIWLSVFLSALFGESIRNLAFSGEIEGLIVMGITLAAFIALPLIILFKIIKASAKKIAGV